MLRTSESEHDSHRLFQEQCCACACKHLAKAWSIFFEIRNGHPEDEWRMMGEIANAEDHVCIDYPDLAKDIRAARTSYEVVKIPVPFGELIAKVIERDNATAMAQLKERGLA